MPPATPSGTSALLAAEPTANPGLSAEVVSLTVVACDAAARLQLVDTRSLRPTGGAAAGSASGTAAAVGTPGAASATGATTPSDIGAAGAALVLTHRIAFELEGAPPLAAGLLVDTRPEAPPTSGYREPLPRAALALALLAHVIHAEGGTPLSVYPHWSSDSGAANTVLVDVARQFRHSSLLSVAPSDAPAPPLLPQHLAVADRLLQLACAIPPAHIAAPAVAPPTAATPQPSPSASAMRP